MVEANTKDSLVHDSLTTGLKRVRMRHTDNSLFFFFDVVRVRQDMHIRYANCVWIFPDGRDGLQWRRRKGERWACEEVDSLNV